MLRIDSWRVWGPVAAVLVAGGGVLPSAPAPQKASSQTLTIPHNRITHDGWVFSASWSPDGKTLASASGNGTVKLWAVATGKEQATFKGHTHGVSSVSWSPDGKTLASADFEGAVMLWDVSPAR
jgi:WD40 repeat protein